MKKKKKTSIMRNKLLVDPDSIQEQPFAVTGFGHLLFTIFLPIV